MSKIILVISAALLTAIFAAKLLYMGTSNSGSEPVHQAWAQDTMEFVAWNNEEWTAWIRDGTFEQLPQDEGKWHRHSNASLAFTDWDGERWQAKIEGDEFLLAHHGNWEGPVERSDAIQYRDWAGRNQLRTVDQLRR